MRVDRAYVYKGLLARFRHLLNWLTFQKINPLTNLKILSLEFDWLTSIKFNRFRFLIFCYRNLTCMDFHFFFQRLCLFIYHVLNLLKFRLQNFFYLSLNDDLYAIKSLYYLLVTYCHIMNKLSSHSFKVYLVSARNRNHFQVFTIMCALAILKIHY